MQKINTMLAPFIIAGLFSSAYAANYHDAFERSTLLQQRLYPSTERRWFLAEKELSFIQKTLIRLCLKRYTKSTTEAFLIPIGCLPNHGRLLFDWCAQLNMHPPLLLYINNDSISIGGAIRLWQTASILLVSQGMLKDLSERDIEFFLAHELGHLHKHHTTKRAALRCVSFLILLSTLHLQNKIHKAAFFFALLCSAIAFDWWYDSRQENEADHIASLLCGNNANIQALHQKMHTQKKYF